MSPIPIPNLQAQPQSVHSRGNTDLGANRIGTHFDLSYRYKVSTIQVWLLTGHLLQSVNQTSDQTGECDSFISRENHKICSYRLIRYIHFGHSQNLSSEHSLTVWVEATSKAPRSLDHEAWSMRWAFIADFVCLKSLSGAPSYLQSKVLCFLYVKTYLSIMQPVWASWLTYEHAW